MSGAVHEIAAKQFAVSFLVHDMAIRGFILHHDETVALGVKREHRNVDLAVVDDVMNQIFESGRIGGDSGGVVESFKIGVQIDACGFDITEVRIAAAIASIFTRDVGSISDNLSRADRRFAWSGVNLAGRMISVLERRGFLRVRACG